MALTPVPWKKLDVWRLLSNEPGTDEAKEAGARNPTWQREYLRVTKAAAAESIPIGHLIEEELEKRNQEQEEDDGRTWRGKEHDKDSRRRANTS